MLAIQPRVITLDRKTNRADKADWAAAKRAEYQYGVQLRKIARHIGDIIRGHQPENQAEANTLANMLSRYADTLTPWANAAARRMVTEVKARSDKQWRTVSEEISRELAKELETPDIGARVKELMASQVQLIRSIPLDAAQRVHELVTKGVVEGQRFTTIANEIAQGGEVSKAKANLIARTETGRATTILTQARAESVGSSGYIWRTSRDNRVRPSHKKMQGKFVAWDEPPKLDGLTGHAGALPNCRCYTEPVLPDEDED